MLRILPSLDRSEELCSTLSAYISLKTRYPDWQRDNPSDTLVVDSSEQKSERAEDLCACIQWQYLHFPNKSLPQKLDHILCQTSLQRTYDYVEFITDQDLFIRCPNRLPDKVDIHVFTNFTLGWQAIRSDASENNVAVYLRDQSALWTTTELKPSLDKQYLRELQCNHPNTNIFWGLLEARCAIIRHRLYMALAEILDPSDHKLIEAFFNVFHSYCSIQFLQEGLILRDSDVSKSLRRTNAKESYAKKSFLQSYMKLIEDRDKHHACLDMLMMSIHDLYEGSIDGESNLLQCDRTILNKLCKCSVLSYSSALSCDFTSRSYLYLSGSLRGQYKYSRHCEPFILPRIYNHMQLGPIVFDNRLSSLDFMFLDPGSPFANRENCKILTSIPESYWAREILPTRL